MCNPKPSLNQKVIDMYDAGYCVHKISKHLGIHLSRVKGVIAHLLAERDLGKKRQEHKALSFGDRYAVQGNLADMEQRILASLFKDEPGLQPVFDFYGVTTGRTNFPGSTPQKMPRNNSHKPRMTPTQYLELARAMADERIAEKQRADEELQALRDINPHKLVAAMEEYEDLAQLATLALNELTRRYGKNSTSS